MKTTILKKIAWLWLPCAMVMPAFLLTGCDDDDDDDDSDGGNATASSMSDVTGLVGTDGATYYLTQSAEMRMTYDEDNNYMLTSFDFNNGDDSDAFELVSESPLKFEYSFYDEDFDENFSETYSSFNTNSNGYLSSFKYSLSDEEEDYEWYDDITYTLSYNDNGQLIELKYTETETDNDLEDGWKYSWKETVNATFTWQDGRIITVSDTFSSTEYDSDEGTVNETGGSTYEFSYDTEYQNIALQYPELAFEGIFYYCEPFPYIGWCGNGPTYLPSSMTYKEIYDDGNYYSESESYSYTFNSNGTIKTENSYSYSYLNDETEKSLSFTELSENETAKVGRKTKRHNHLKHRAKRATTTSAEE